MVESSEIPFKEVKFFELTPDLVCIAGKDGYFRNVNPAVVLKLGYSQSELFQYPIDYFMHPEDRQQTLNQRTDLLNGKALLNFQNRYITKKGETIWLEWSSIYYAEAEIVLAIAKDITEKKLMEKELENKYQQFKSLATHFKSRMEEDRRYVANELHEEVAQLATILKVEIDALGRTIPGISVETESKLKHASVLTELLINTLRRIFFSISPKILDDLGLAATIEWLCREFSLLNGIPCQFKADFREDDLSREIKMDFFRICQESLSNIMYHAGAANVSVDIISNHRVISLSITDDGIGFDAETQEGRPRLP